MNLMSLQNSQTYSSAPFSKIPLTRTQVSVQSSGKRIFFQIPFPRKKSASSPFLLFVGENWWKLFFWRTEKKQTDSYQKRYSTDVFHNSGFVSGLKTCIRLIHGECDAAFASTAEPLSRLCRPLNIN